MADPTGILTEEDFQRITKGIQDAEQAENIIALAKQAGMDVSAQEQRAKEGKAQLLKIKNTFFPGR